MINIYIFSNIIGIEEIKDAEIELKKLNEKLAIQKV